MRRATASSDIQSLTGLSQDRLDRVVAAFHAEGFLNVWQSPNDESVLVDLTHEAVARQWRELREWMVEESRVRRNIRRVAEAASDWAKHERNRAYLFRGLQLTESQTYLRGRDHLLDAMSKAFLKASRRNEVWNRVLSPGVLVGILFLVMVLGGLTYISVTKATLATRADRAARKFVTRAQDEAELAKKAQQEAIFNEQSATALAARLVQPTSANTIQPRVDIQIRSQEQRAQAQGLADPLKAAGFVVPAIQNVAVGTNSTEVRYFRKTDETGAKRILDVLTGNKVTAKPVLVQGYETSTRIRDAHFELWLASPTVVEPALSSRRLTSAQTEMLIGPANAGCKPVTATFSPATGDPLQKIDLQLEYTQCDDFRSSIRFKTFSRETADSAFDDPDGSADFNETKRSPDNE